MVIHVATAHHHSGDWIPLQRQYLDRHLAEPYLLYGSLEGVPEEFERYFDVVVPSMGDHAGKLNLMGHRIARDADSDDLIMFLDGDAFPVADVLSAVRPLLATSALVAVQRLENHGDSQPHPCFCVVPVHVWRDLPGDWTSGHCFREGRTDVGGNLQWLLDDRGLTWAPLLRTHSLAQHDLLFAVYGGLVYHHGAGFRGLKPPGQGATSGRPRSPTPRPAWPGWSRCGNATPNGSRSSWRRPWRRRCSASGSTRRSRLTRRSSTTCCGHDPRHHRVCIGMQLCAYTRDPWL